MTTLVDYSADGHVHTSLCHHATGTMEEYVQSAIAKGLKRLMFLEHFEVGIQYFESTWLTKDDFTYYFQEGKRLKEKYAQAIEVSIGVEIGYNPMAIKDTLRCLATYHSDRVGLSCQFIAENGVHITLFRRK